MRKESWMSNNIKELANNILDVEREASKQKKSLTEKGGSDRRKAKIKDDTVKTILNMIDMEENSGED